MEVPLIAPGSTSVATAKFLIGIVEIEGKQKQKAASRGCSSTQAPGQPVEISNTSFSLAEYSDIYLSFRA
jgi:hypothetical protein